MGEGQTILHDKLTREEGRGREKLKFSIPYKVTNTNQLFIKQEKGAEERGRNWE